MNKAMKWLTAITLVVGLAAAIKSYIILPYRMDAADARDIEVQGQYHQILKEVMEMKLMLARIEERQKIQDRRGMATR